MKRRDAFGDEVQNWFCLLCCASIALPAVRLVCKRFGDVRVSQVIRVSLRGETRMTRGIIDCIGVGWCGMLGIVES